MAWTILAALSRAVRRDTGSFSPAGFNNLFFFVGVILLGAFESGVEPKASYPFFLFILLVMMFPLSGDPLDKIPPSRLGLWPLSPRQRIEIRIASILVSPVLWLGVALILFKRIRPAIAIAFLTAVIGVQILATVARAIPHQRGGALKMIRFGGLIRNHVRQQLQVLDTYVALIFAAGGIFYRNPDARPILAMFTALTLSTYAQNLFGLDRASRAMVRYQLFPLRGWRILLSKDLAFLLILLVMVLPVDPIPGLTFGFVALAAGHHPNRIALRRWRFAGGVPFIGVVQCAGGFLLGMAAHRVSAAFLLLALAIYLASLLVYGRAFGRRD